MSTLLDPHDVAESLGVNTRTLTRWRRVGIGPAWVQVGERCVRYRREDLDAFLARSVRTPASEGAA